MSLNMKSALNIGAKCKNSNMFVEVSPAGGGSYHLTWHSTTSAIKTKMTFSTKEALENYVENIGGPVHTLLHPRELERFEPLTLFQIKNDSTIYVLTAMKDLFNGSMEFIYFNPKRSSFHSETVILGMMSA